MSTCLRAIEIDRLPSEAGRSVGRSLVQVRSPSTGSTHIALRECLRCTANSTYSPRQSRHAANLRIEYWSSRIPCRATQRRFIRTMRAIRHACGGEVAIRGKILRELCKPLQTLSPAPLLPLVLSTVRTIGTIQSDGDLSFHDIPASLPPFADRIIQKNRSTTLEGPRAREV